MHASLSSLTSQAALPEDQGFQAWLEGLLDSDSSNNSSNSNGYGSDEPPSADASSFVVYGGKAAVKQGGISIHQRGGAGEDTEGAQAPSSSSSHGEGGDSSQIASLAGLKGMVTTLLREWHEHLSTLPATSAKGLQSMPAFGGGGSRTQHHRASSSLSAASSGALSSAEVKFFQRVADLVQMSHEKVAAAENR